MKKKIFALAIICLPVFVLAGFAAPANAADFTISLPNLLEVNSVEDLLLNIISHLQTILAFIAVLFIIIAGIVYMVSGGSEDRVKLAKKIWTGAIIGLVIILIAPTLLKEIKSVFLRDGNLPSDFEDVLTLREIIFNVLEFLLSIIGVLAIISLVISGFTYLFSVGDSNRAETAKKMIKWSLVGLILAGASVIIVKQITVFFT